MGKRREHKRFYHHETLLERAERKLTRKGWRVARKNGGRL